MRLKLLGGCRFRELTAWEEMDRGNRKISFVFRCQKTTETKSILEAPKIFQPCSAWLWTGLQKRDWTASTG